MDNKVPCVYNSNHMLKPERLVWHYVKCEDRRRQQHLYSICPYNSMHHVPITEFDAHVIKCKPPEQELKLNFGNDDPWG